MNYLVKNRILISPEQQKSQIGLFFLNLGLELCTNFNKELSAEYLFIVDDYLEQLQDFPRIQTKKIINSTCAKEIRGCFDESFIKDELVNSLLSSYFRDPQNFDLVDCFSKDFQKIFTLKIQDYLNVGYFIDTIVLEAYKNKFDCDLIRNYLNYAINYAIKLTEEDDSLIPLDISFANNESGFVVQISTSVKDFNINLQSRELENFSSSTNYFGASYFKKRDRLLLSSLWFKDKDLRPFKAFFLSEISGRSSKSEVKSTLISRMNESLERVKYEGGFDSANKYSKLYIARKFTLFIKKYRVFENNPLDLASLTVDDINKYLSQYPRHEATFCADVEIRKYIIKLLNDDNLYHGISSYIHKVAVSNLDPHIDEIQRIISEKTLDDLNEILILKSWRKDENNYSNNDYDWTATSNKEEWKIKRVQLIDSINEQAEVIKSAGRNIVEGDFTQIALQQLNINPEDAGTIVKGLVEEAISSTFVKKEKLEEVLALQLLAQQSAQELDRKKLEFQIVRIKNSMIQMKSEIVRLRAEGDSDESENSNPTNEVVNLKKALNRSLTMLKENEKTLLKQKSDFDKIIEIKEKNNQISDAIVKHSKDESAKDSDIEIERKLELLQKENKSLVSRLELANQKIISMTESMGVDKNANEILVKKDQEILNLKNNIHFAQSLIDKFRSERIRNENKISNEEKVNKFQNEKLIEPGGLPDESMNKDLTAFNNFQAEKKAMEEKQKDQKMELKKMENKLKFTIAQLEEAQKRKNPSENALNKSNESYTKSLDTATLKLAAANTDIIEKKKEVIRLKQENAHLTTKVFELEKKLAFIEKKAA